MGKSFPIEVKKDTSKNITAEKDSFLYLESLKYYKAVSSAGGLANMGNGVSGGLAWRTQTKGATVIDTWYDIQTGIILPTAGRSVYVYKISIDVTDACAVGVRQRENGSIYGVAGDQTPNLNGVFEDIIFNQNNPAGGTILIDFVALEGKPRKVPFGEQISILASNNSLTTDATKKTNYMLTISGVEVCSDENFAASYLMGVMGDSIQVPVSDTGELEYTESNGSIRGIWPAIVRKHLRDNGIDCRWSDIAIGGSNSTQWEVKTSRGLFTNWKPDILFCGLGMNDAGSPTYFRTTAGVDGIFTTAYKSIIKSYFYNVVDGCCIVSQVTDSDEAGRVVVFSSGIYNGLTRIQAIRLEVSAVVSELLTANPTWDLRLADTSPGQTFTASDKANYVTAEQGVGASVHPNARLGQPKMAIKINQAVDASIFFNKNKTH